jgi:hypothetical protein
MEATLEPSVQQNQLPGLKLKGRPKRSPFFRRELQYQSKIKSVAKKREEGQVLTQMFLHKDILELIDVEARIAGFAHRGELIASRIREGRPILTQPTGGDPTR